MPLKKKIKIKEAKMGGHLLGQAIKEGDDYTILISKSHRTEKSRLNTVVHEALHVGDFELTEADVRRLTSVVTEVLWREGYRRVKQ
jgi:KaiC/GvpD/RAD55 family RecA-like ATPase